MSEDRFFQSMGNFKKDESTVSRPSDASNVNTTKLMRESPGEQSYLR